MASSVSRPNGSRSRHTFISLLRVVPPVVAAPQVAARWQEPSALAEFSVGGLAGHLVRAALVVDSYLNQPPPTDQEAISPAAYFAGLNSDLTSSSNVAIRRRGEDLAAAGHDHLVAALDRLAVQLPERLVNEADDRLLTVAGNAVMRLDPYLVTRIVELTVHTDDLAVSVGLALPELPPEALDLTIHTLVDVARYRHGDLAVLRALSRRERQTIDILRAF